MAEAFAIHAADMQSRLEDYGEITANRFVLGAAITAADYINALRARRQLTDAVNAALGRYDALLTASALALRRGSMRRSMRCPWRRRCRRFRSTSQAIRR